MARSIERRDFLKIAAATGGLAALGLTGWTGNASTLLEGLSRTRRPDALRDLSDVPDRSVSLGISPDKNGVDEVFQNEEQLHISFDLVNYFIAGINLSDQQGVLKNASRMAEIHKTPMISWAPMPVQHMTESGFTSYIQELVHKMGEIDHEVLFRFWFEMNGDWFGRIGGEEYVHLWNIVRSETQAFENIRLVFCPNFTSAAVRSFGEYYPGNSNVDYVALDFYNKFDPNILHDAHGMPNLSAEQLMGPDIALLQDITHQSVPFFIGELGTYRDDVEGAQWMVEAIHYAVRCKPEWISLFCWDQSKKQVAGEKDWRFKDGPLLRALQREFQARYFRV